MKRLYTALLFIALYTFLIPSALLSQVDQMPPEADYIMDSQKILNPDEFNELNDKLKMVDNHFKKKIYVVFGENRKDFNHESFISAFRNERSAAETGIVILVLPKSGLKEPEAIISIGKDLIGKIPETTGKIIADHEMKTSFRAKKYMEGLEAGIEVFSKLINDEISYKEYEQDTKTKPAAIVLVILIVALFILVSRMIVARKYAKINDLPFWTAFRMANIISQHHGHFEKFSKATGKFKGVERGGGGAWGSW